MTQPQAKMLNESMSMTDTPSKAPSRRSTTPKLSTPVGGRSHKQPRISRSFTSTKAYFKGKSGQRRALMIGTAVTVLVILLGVIVYLVRSRNSQSTNRLKDWIDMSIDPCVDFHQHACGQWDRKLIEADQDMVNKMPALLTNKAFHRGVERYSGKVKHGSKAVQFMVDLLVECADGGAREEIGLEPLTESLKQLVGEQWPVMPDKSGLKVDLNSEGWMDIYAKYRLMAGSGLIIKFIISPGTLMFKAEENFTPKDDSKAYLLFGYLSTILDLEMSQLVNNKDYSDIVNAQIELENRISEYEGSSGTSKVSWSSLKAKQPDLIKLMEVVTRHSNATLTFTNSDPVYVNLDYLNHVASVLSDTPLWVLKNYFGWRFVYASQLLLTTRLARIEKTEEVINGLDQCLELVQGEGVFNLPQTRLLLDEIRREKEQPVERVIQKLSEMVSHLKDAFGDMLTTADWLDDSTRANARTKLNGVTHVIGGPEWISNDAQLDEWHELPSDMKVVKGNFFESRTKWIVLMMARAIRRYKDSSNFDGDVEWQSGNAYYSKPKNMIIVPFGFLSYPTFDLTEPDSINYGRAGVIIGHELTHGFDNRGSKIDERGNRREWWSRESRDKFNRRANCMVRQYSAVVEPITGLPLNGYKTLHENIADNGGLKEAYLAFVKYVKPERRAKLIELPRSLNYADFSDDQLFFYSYAQFFCDALGAKATKQFIRDNSHTLPKYRVNVVLGNTPQFATTFNCSLGSPMNPEKKCSVW